MLSNPSHAVGPARLPRSAIGAGGMQADLPPAAWSPHAVSLDAALPVHALAAGADSLHRGAQVRMLASPG